MGHYFNIFHGDGISTVGRVNFREKQTKLIFFQKKNCFSYLCLNSPYIFAIQSCLVAVNLMKILNQSRNHCFNGFILIPDILLKLLQIIKNSSFHFDRQHFDFQFNFIVYGIGRAAIHVDHRLFSSVNETLAMHNVLLDDFLQWTLFLNCSTRGNSLTKLMYDSQTMMGYQLLI